jgi:hypothetical protein
MIFNQAHDLGNRVKPTNRTHKNKPTYSLQLYASANRNLGNQDPMPHWEVDCCVVVTKQVRTET